MIRTIIHNSCAILQVGVTAYVLQYYNRISNQVEDYFCDDFVYYMVLNNNIIFEIQLRPACGQYAIDIIDNYSRIEVLLYSGDVHSATITINEEPTQMNIEEYILRVIIKKEVLYTAQDDTEQDQTFIAIKPNFIPKRKYKPMYEIYKHESLSSQNNFDVHEYRYHTKSLTDIEQKNKTKVTYLSYQDRICTKREVFLDNNINNPRKSVIVGFWNYKRYINLMRDWYNYQTNDYTINLSGHSSMFYYLLSTSILHQRDGSDFYNKMYANANDTQPYYVYNSGFKGFRPSIYYDTNYNLFNNTISNIIGMFITPNIYTYINQDNNYVIGYYDIKYNRSQEIRYMRRFPDAVNDLVKSSNLVLNKVGFLLPIDYNKLVNYVADDNNSLFIYNSSRQPPLKVSASFYVYMLFEVPNNIICSGGGYLGYVQQTSDITVQIAPWQKIVVRNHRLESFYKKYDIDF
jgi:hypothetical protein